MANHKTSGPIQPRQIVPELIGMNTTSIQVTFTEHSEIKHGHRKPPARAHLESINHHTFHLTRNDSLPSLFATLMFSLQAIRQGGALYTKLFTSLAD